MRFEPAISREKNLTRRSLSELKNQRELRHAPRPPARWHKPMVVALVIAMLLTTTGMVGGSGLFVDKKVITLRHQSVESQAVTYADTVGEFLVQQGIFLMEGDELLPGEDTPLTDGMTVQVDQVMTIIVQYRGQQQRLALNRGTVADALDAVGIVLDEADQVDHDPDELLSDNMTIVVTTFDESVLTQVEPLPYAVVEVESDALYVGKKQLFREGQEGKLERIITVRYRDGLEISREVTSEKVTVRRYNEIVLVGTKPTPTPTPKPTPSPSPTPKKTTKTTTKSTTKITTTKSSSTTKAKTSKAVSAQPTVIPELTVDYVKTLTCEITAYTHTGEQTAIGTWPRATRTLDNPGTVAVAPQTIPYHTLLYVPGYGYCVAEDTGGFRNERPYQIDLFMDTEEECNEWGRRRNKTVYIIQYNYERK